MRHKLATLVTRREALISQIEGQRQELNSHYALLEKKMRWPELAFRIGASLPKNSSLFQLAILAWSLFSPRLRPLPARLSSAWQGTKIVLSLWQKFRSGVSRRP
jgi:hypothetical protein